MDRFEAMQRFVLVAQTGSFTRASEVLGLPKSSISSAIQSLETRLETRLFHRTTRRVTLTQDGDAYYYRCQTLLSELDALESQFQYQNDAVRGVLRVDVPSRFASTIIFPHLQEWLDTYPNVHVKISCSDHQINLIEEGVDCVVRVGELTESTLVARPLINYHIVNCASPEYIKKYGQPGKLSDLKNHVLIDYAPKMEAHPPMFEYVEGGKVKQFEMPSALTVNNTDAYLAACLSGLGIAQIPKIGAWDHLKQGSLIPLLPTVEAEPMPVFLLYPTRRHIPKRLSLFMDWLEQLVKRLGVDSANLSL